MNIFERRPFRVRNAEEFDLQEVLDLFVEPLPDLRSPFDYENSIVKGGMGSGKTMYLRANHALYLYSLVPSLIQGEEVTLPIYLQLNEHQTLRDPDAIYKSVILGLVEAMCAVYRQLQDCDALCEIHKGIKRAPNLLKRIGNGFSDELLRLRADEYVSLLKKTAGGSSALEHGPLKASLKYEKETLIELRGKPRPTISDIQRAYDSLFGSHPCRLLVLLDEVSSLHHTFFNPLEGESLFRGLMNQLRTTDFIRTKVAIYPNSPADVLSGTRHGDIKRLSEDVFDERGFARFRTHALALVDRYLTRAVTHSTTWASTFDFSPSPGDTTDSLAQLIWTSRGNTRRLVRLLDECMTIAFADHQGHGLVRDTHVHSCLVNHSQSIQSLYSPAERQFIERVARTCRLRQTHKFTFPKRARALTKFINRSEEEGMVYVADAGSGRKGTTYSLDYAYCVANKVPTHTPDTDTGGSRWISHSVRISGELSDGSILTGRITGEVVYTKNDSGLIKGSDATEYFFLRDSLADREMTLPVGAQVHFFPGELGTQKYAFCIELSDRDNLSLSR